MCIVCERMQRCFSHCVFRCGGDDYDVLPVCGKKSVCLLSLAVLLCAIFGDSLFCIDFLSIFVFVEWMPLDNTTMRCDALYVSCCCCPQFFCVLFVKSGTGNSSCPTAFRFPPAGFYRQLPGAAAEPVFVARCTVWPLDSQVSRNSCDKIPPEVPA